MGSELEGLKGTIERKLYLSSLWFTGEAMSREREREASIKMINFLLPQAKFLVVHGIIASRFRAESEMTRCFSKSFKWSFEYPGSSLAMVI